MSFDPGTMLMGLYAGGHSNDSGGHPDCRIEPGALMALPLADVDPERCCLRCAAGTRAAAQALQATTQFDQVAAAANRLDVTVVGAALGEVGARRYATRRACFSTSPALIAAEVLRSWDRGGYAEIILPDLAPVELHAADQSAVHTFVVVAAVPEPIADWAAEYTRHANDAVACPVVVRQQVPTSGTVEVATTLLASGMGWAQALAAAECLVRR
jgi:hypothetical protein